VAPNAFLLFASSVAVYGDRLKNPMIHIDDPVDETQEDGYALSKIAAEAIVRESGLDYSIFRLSAIMGLGNHKVSKILFHVPLETPMEIATVRDTARAFRLALNHREALKGQTFNLSGGEACRVLYKDFLSTLFRFYGLGKADFPAHSFATANFHCGFFHDADVLENILKFRRDTLDSYYTDFRNAVPGWMRISAACFRVPVKFFLGRLSEPRRALLQGDPAKIRLFFGDDPPALNE
jgi:nucleoside-diphosphate-sugar epimerase